LKEITFILKSFRLLRDHQPGRLVTIALVTLLSGITSGFSIVLLIPLLHLLEVGSEQPADRIASFFRYLSEKIGFEISILSILVVFIILLTIAPLLQYLKSTSDAWYQQTFISNLRKRLFRKIISADWEQL
jgi:ATP-binding cassette, subfamily C, bacterial